MNDLRKWSSHNLIRSLRIFIVFQWHKLLATSVLCCRICTCYFLLWLCINKGFFFQHQARHRAYNWVPVSTKTFRKVFLPKVHAMSGVKGFLIDVNMDTDKCDCVVYTRHQSSYGPKKPPQRTNQLLFYGTFL